MAAVTTDQAGAAAKCRAVDAADERNRQRVERCEHPRRDLLSDDRAGCRRLRAGDLLAVQMDCDPLLAPVLALPRGVDVLDHRLHPPLDGGELALLAQQVEDALRATGSAEIPAQEVGLAILGPLRELDEVAYLRFASVYRSFDTLDDFEAEIALLRAEGDPVGEEPARTSATSTTNTLTIGSVVARSIE